MKKNLTQSERALTAELEQAFAKFERAFIKANCELIKDVRSIGRTHEDMILAFDGDEIADVYQTLIKAYHIGELTVTPELFKAYSIRRSKIGRRMAKFFELAVKTANIRHGRRGGQLERSSHEKKI